MDSTEIIKALEFLKHSTQDITIRHHINAAILRTKQLAIASECDHELIRAENPSPYGMVVDHTCTKCGEVISSKLDK